MSDHDNDQCGIRAMLPAALGCLDHVHECHSEHEITSYIGQGAMTTDIYIVSGSAREKFRELRDSLNQKSSADVAELYRMAKLKPSRKGSAKRTAQKSRPQP